MAQLMNAFGGDTLNGVASMLGESSASTQTALGGALPALVGGLVNQASTPTQANALLDLMKRSKLDAGPFTDPSTALRAPDGMQVLMSAGRPLMNSLFGGRSGGIADWVSSLSGVSRSSSSSLLAMALPLVLGQIGKYVSGAGWNASSLMGFLGEQKGFLRDAPAGLASVLNAGDTEVKRPAVAYDADEARTRVAAPAMAPETTPSRRSAWLWAVPLLLLIPLLGFFLTRRDEPRPAAVNAPTRTLTPPSVPDAERPVATTLASVAGLGPFVERQLPNNLSLRIPSNGMESKLIAYIDDPAPVGTGTAFSFDRFETDSATLRPESSEQLRNIADILKAYPNVRVKIGGYTDNTGDAAQNVQLSQARSAATMNHIAGLGIDPSRMEAEGHGSANPVADNGTPEGRQRNRRVDISVTQK
jgi:outer membrane protein OmpA-like peptidoglycan-associated protein